MRQCQTFLYVALISVAAIYRDLKHSLVFSRWQTHKAHVEAPVSPQQFIEISDLTTKHNHSTAVAITQLEWNSTERPPRSMFVEDTQVKPEAQFLIDFAVVGFAKAGTTTLGTWLHNHPQIKMSPNENFGFRSGPLAMTNSMYRNLPENFDHSWLRKGYRCPMDVVQPVMVKHIRNFYPETKFIITVRHPFEWFESFYNYRLLAGELRFIKGTPNELIGSLECCIRDPNFLSTSTGEFHKYLARLGKTPLESDDEISLLAPFADKLANISKPDFNLKVSNPVFFLDTHQLGDKNETRSMTLRRDLQQYLGLEDNLAPIPHIRPKEKNDSKNITKISLCEDQYLPVRTELMRISRAASTWIRNYFLKAQDVHVSSPDFLEEILESWMEDPCS